MNAVVQLVAIFCIVQSTCGAENCDDKVILCREQTSCDTCIQAHSCCNYCYHETFQSSKCDVKDNLITNGCPTSSIQDSGGSTRLEIPKYGNEPFSDFTPESGAIQLKPQHFKLYLRKGESQHLQFTYRPTRNYPLDLYYLMDVSYTMADDIDTITRLGSQLARQLQVLTKNFRIALGLYSEKNAMPFSYTDKSIMDEHCYENRVRCVEGFDFKHRLNFTDEIGEFIRRVRQLKNETTMNVDEPEAGLDALMQIMSCGGYMDWLPNSRKIVVMATDGTLHYAGDGVLAGATKRNFSQCWLDAEGVYTKSLENDYPSLEEIYRKLLSTKINAVFAAKTNVIDYYKSINELMPDLTYTAKLEEKSQNVIELVKSGYQSFIKHIKFSTNTSDAEELRVTFRSNCSEQNFLKVTQTCENIMEGMVYTFDVEVELVGDVPVEKTGATIFIEEQDINERVQVDVEYIGNRCECSNEAKTEVNVKSCGNGEYRCGQCNCYEGSTGEFCNLTCIDRSMESCRQTTAGGVSLLCNGRGDCDCGYCKCDFGYTGKHCQHLCPVKHRKVCDGHGVCIDGTCNCHPDYTGETCSCLVSKETCSAPGREECSGRGVCKCGSCECLEGYYGRFCERCPTCSGFCGTYDDYVIGNLSGEKKDVEGVKQRVVFAHGDLNDIEEKCTVRYRKDETLCDADYKYRMTPDSVLLSVLRSTCWKPMAATMKVGVVVAILLAVGIIGILLYKCYLVQMDRIEYARFEEKQRHELRSENPLYVSPISNYEVPIEMRNLHDKEE